MYCNPFVVNEEYLQTRKKPFAVSSPGNHLVLLSSKEHIKELIDAPESQFSLQPVIDDVSKTSIHSVTAHYTPLTDVSSIQIFKPKFTMFGFNVQKDVSATQGIAHRVLRTLLTANIPNLQPALRNRIEEAFAQDFASSSFLDATNWKMIPTFAMARRIVVKVNSLAFVGEELCRPSDSANMWPDPYHVP